VQEAVIVKGLQVHIGMDDIDSPSGGCTTHFASLLVEHLESIGVEWLDYPLLIRLNPAVPYRTRGNGAVGLRLRMDSNSVNSIMEYAEKAIDSYVNRTYPNTNPGFVIVHGQVPQQIHNVAEQALWRALPRSLAGRVAEDHAHYYYSKGNSRGLIGALAAIGNRLDGDHTYEYIAYRSLEDCSQDRGVDGESVLEMDKRMGDLVFGNLDTPTGRVIVDPHGPDPVLYGLRGETAPAVLEASKQVRSRQQVDRWMIFRTNQGTGAHLNHDVRISGLRPYMAAVVEAAVRKPAWVMEGGHVILQIADDTGLIDAAAYEPTGGFRRTIQSLAVDDICRFYGSVRPRSRTHELTLNLEGIEILELSRIVKSLNPPCPECGKRLKSAGRDKGFKCTRCGFKSSDLAKEIVEIERTLEKGIYLPPESAQRHLTRPLVRQDKSNCGVPLALIEKWHEP
jgi:tRNA(Ile2)-agmatinylcytidine synthase